MPFDKKSSIDWEKGESGFIKSIFLTCFRVLTSPNKSFANVNNDCNIFWPIVFAIIMIVAFSTIGMAWNYFYHNPFPPLTLEYILAHLLYLPGMIILSVVLQLLLASFCLILIGLKIKSLKPLIRVYSYAMSALVFCLIPSALIVPVMFVWYTIIIIYGIHNAFSITKFHSFAVLLFSVLIPPMVAMLVRTFI